MTTYKQTNKKRLPRRDSEKKITLSRLSVFYVTWGEGRRGEEGEERVIGVRQFIEGGVSRRRIPGEDEDVTEGGQG